MGWPQSIQSDGGPQFRCEFVNFFVENGISHELSAPYNPRSNGLAESGVKIVKSILKNVLGRGETCRERYTSGGMLHAIS